MEFAKTTLNNQIIYTYNMDKNKKSSIREALKNIKRYMKSI
jgi:hypothetical protein